MALTKENTPSAPTRASQLSPPTHVLVLLWSRVEPHRIGEVLRIPTSTQPWLFGRGDTTNQGMPFRLTLCQQRPNGVKPIGQVSNPSISREQLRLQVLDGETLQIENVGQCALLLNGIPVQRAEVRPGDLLELEHQLLFLCQRRPLNFTPFPAELKFPPHAFGQVDATGLVGESEALWRLRRSVAEKAVRTGHVLIHGESGTGKELAAQGTHLLSNRSSRAMVSRNAATFPDGLIDIELFGNVMNYPNPGMREHQGMIGEADQSTLFLDEIGELPIQLQARLLRVMSCGEYHRLGDSKPRKARFRLIAATNRDLIELKHDLVSRFDQRIEVPSLNDRREDIPLLIRHLLRKIATSDSTVAGRFFPDADPGGEPRLTPTLIAFLTKYHYTTNVLELLRLLWNSIDSSEAGILDVTNSMVPVEPQPASVPAAIIDADDEIRLRLLRRNGFRVSDCARDPDYPGERSTVDRDLRVLLFKALIESGLRVADAATRLAGDSAPHVRLKVLKRLETTLENLRRDLSTDGEVKVREDLRNTYHRSASWGEQVLNALRDGRIA